MYLKVNGTIGKVTVHYELGDLLVSNFYKGDFIVIGLGIAPYRFSLLCIDSNDIVPVDVDLRICPEGMFRPFMESEGFYK